MTFALETQNAPTDVRALTLTQPWAWLVANGLKDVENRPRGFSFKSFRGRFYIHAAVESRMSIEAFRAARVLCDRRGIALPTASSLNFGGIVGVATVTGIVPPGDSGHSWHFPDQYGFLLADAQEVPFVACRGFQGFWRLPTDVLRKLAENGESR